MAGKVDSWISAVELVIAQQERKIDERNQKIAGRFAQAKKEGVVGGNAQTNAFADIAMPNAKDFLANRKDKDYIYQMLRAVQHAMRKRNQNIDNIWKNS